MNMAEISKQINVQTETRAEVEERAAKIRAANIRIRDLERQIGELAQIDLTIQSVKLLEEKFQHWWRTQGLGHTSKFSIRGSGAKATLSAYLYGNHSSMFSKTPVSDKENGELWIQSLVDKGYTLTGTDGDGQGNIELVDCDKNRALIKEFIAQQLPSAEIMSTANSHTKQRGAVIRDIKIFIRDLHDIDALSAPPRQ